MKTSAVFLNKRSGTQNNAIILEVSGEVSMMTSHHLRDALVQLYADQDRIIVDLSAVDYADSAAVATLVEGMSWSRACDRQFALSRVSRSVYDVLRLTKLESVFPILNEPEMVC